MWNQTDKTSADEFIDNESFKSFFARSVVVNSQYKQSRMDMDLTKKQDHYIATDSPTNIQEQSIHFRKNHRSSSMEDARRFSCGGIVSRRASVAPPGGRNGIPVENIFNQNKIETLQWQLREVEKSREMYRAVMKQVVTFLEKAHVSLEHLGTRLNRKHPTPQLKNEQLIIPDRQDNPQTPLNHLAIDPITSWNSNKNKSTCHPEEVPPEKLSQEAFRLLRTAQSILNTQEPNLTSPEIVDEPSDIEFLAQLAKEFPSDGQKPQRTPSFSLSPKLILPEPDVRISTALNRKLSLQLGSGSLRRRNLRLETTKVPVEETECYSLPVETNTCTTPLTISDLLMNRSCKPREKTPPSSSTASTEDESGFSSLNSFQDVGLPLVNSTTVEEVSARTVLLKSMLHNPNDPENTLTSMERNYPPQENNRLSMSDVKLWQRTAPSRDNEQTSSPVRSSGNHKRWNSIPEPKNENPSINVLWV